MFNIYVAVKQQLKLGEKSNMAAQPFWSPLPLLQQVACVKDGNLLDTEGEIHWSAWGQCEGKASIVPCCSSALV